MKINPIRARFTMPLIHEAADRFMVTPEEILEGPNYQTVAHARAYAIWLARTRFGWSYPELGIVFGMNNTSCRHACLETEKRLGAEPKSGPGMAKIEPIGLGSRRLA